MKHIELFAGCGGLTLGLESEGFQLLFANELSPMASETFAFNHLGIDLKDLNAESSDKVYWLSSKYPRSEIRARLNANPQGEIGLVKETHDLDKIQKDPFSLNNSLLIGSILDLNKLLETSAFASSIQTCLGDDKLDLVSGGPPCQSFSMAGMREHHNERNSLPWAFAEFVHSTQPRMALLENVSGILHAFNVEGEKHYAWYEVAIAFVTKEYIPICLHVNAKYVGAAQNRPRFIMLAFKHDVFNSLLANNCDPFLEQALTNSLGFYNKVKAEGENIEFGHLDVHDVEDPNCSIYNSPFFSPLVSNMKRANPSSRLITAREAIDDLNCDQTPQSTYVRRINREAFKTTSISRRLNKELQDRIAKGELPENQEHRGNSPKVKARFRLYQVLNDIDSNETKNIVRSYLKSGDQSILSTRIIDDLRKSSWLMTTSGKPKNNFSRKEIKDLLSCLLTKKQTQKALIAERPAPAALSIPDDACHYDENTQRTLTVREMARFQSFPDWFVFKSKVTTGGQMRKYQVPQYTQVGNAVPPLLGKALGKVCKELLNQCSK